MGAITGIYFMRLCKQRGIYYVEFKRGRKRSLRTKNEREARSLFKELKKQEILGNLVKLEKDESYLLSEFQSIYKNHPDRISLSIKTHEADKTAFKFFIQAVGDLKLNQILKTHITKFKMISSARGICDNSINSYLRHIRAALNFAEDNGFTKKAPKIKLLKTKNNLVRFIHQEDLSKILEQARETKPEMFRIINFVLYTGCRREEIIKARYEHIHGEIITVHGKGNKKRLVPLIESAKEVLENKNTGKIFKYKHASTLSNYFRKLARSCGVAARFHDLRHTAATQMLKNGIPLDVIQKILGHSDIRTTQIYAQVLEKTLLDEMSKLSY